MKLLDRASEIHEEGITPDSPEAIIPEARMRARRRHLISVITVVSVVAAGLATGLLLSFSPRVAKRSPAGESARSVATVRSYGALPVHPYVLTVASNGDLYVVDTGRDQILKRLPSGQFEVVAGDGRYGFSGDGGPAVHAELRLDYQSGVAVAKDGSIYFSDSQNGRVRVVEPDGDIATVAGGGKVPLSQKPIPALAADFGTPWQLFGLAIGPNGDLYIGTENGVYRLSGSTLYWVVGSAKVTFPKNWGGVYSNPAIQNDFSSATRLAFDGKGDLLVAGGGGWGLYEKTTTGKLRFIENFRGDGFWGSLAEAPDGTVVLAGGAIGTGGGVGTRGYGLARFYPNGRIEPISGNLSAALGRSSGPHHDENFFRTGDGVAVAPNGTIYADTNTGNALTSVNAIVAVEPDGQVRALWRS
jgi:trimeric autotransporter adhesin